MGIGRRAGRFFLMMTFLILFIAAFGIFTVPAEASEGVLNVADYGACGEDDLSDREPITAALRDAAGDGGGDVTEVYVPDGIYYIDGYLGIYSDTWLHLSDGAVIVRMDGHETESMLIGVHDDGAGHICYWDCGHTGYGQCVNVTISGGEWDGGVSPEDAHTKEQSLEIMSFRHASGITIRDTVMGWTDGHHMVNLDGVRDFTMSGVTVHDHMRNANCGASEEDMKCREAVHTDIISPGHIYSSAYPLEDLACGNILVENCTFVNCVSGVGTHNGMDGLYTDGFTVTGCEFRDIDYHAVNAVNFRGMQISGNHAENVSCFITAYGCRKSDGLENVISGNCIVCEPHMQYESCIDLCRGTEAAVTDNTVHNAGTYGISCANFSDDSLGQCSVVIGNNRVINPGNCAIYVRDGCNASVTGNTVSSEGNMGNADRTIGIFFNHSSGDCRTSGNSVSGFEYGIEACNSSGIRMEGDLVTGSSVFGISLYHTEETELMGCSVNDCTVEVQVDASRAKIDDMQDAEVRLLNGSEIEGETVSGNNSRSVNENAGSLQNKKQETEKNPSPTGREQAPDKNPATTAREKTSDENASSKGENLGSKKNASPADKEKKTENSAASASKESRKDTVKKKNDTYIPVYRVFNTRTGEHLYTVSKLERDVLSNGVWRNEGIGWYAPERSDTPVYRVYNPNSGEHHYTKSAVERFWLIGRGWRDEGIGWYSDDNKSVPVYRHYQPFQRTGNHHYTMSKGESEHIVNYEGWRYEGIGWYGVRAEDGR